MYIYNKNVYSTKHVVEPAHTQPIELNGSASRFPTNSIIY